MKKNKLLLLIAILVGSVIVIVAILLMRNVLFQRSITETVSKEESLTKEEDGERFIEVTGAVLEYDGSIMKIEELADSEGKTKKIRHMKITEQTKFYKRFKNLEKGFESFELEGGDDVIIKKGMTVTAVHTTGSIINGIIPTDEIFYKKK